MEFKSTQILIAAGGSLCAIDPSAHCFVNGVVEDLQTIRTAEDAALFCRAYVSLQDLYLAVLPAAMRLSFARGGKNPVDTVTPLVKALSEMITRFPSVLPLLEVTWFGAIIHRKAQAMCEPIDGADGCFRIIPQDDVRNNKKCRHKLIDIQMPLVGPLVQTIIRIHKETPQHCSIDSLKFWLEAFFEGLFHSGEVYQAFTQVLSNSSISLTDVLAGYGSFVVSYWQSAVEQANAFNRIYLLLEAHQEELKGNEKAVKLCDRIIAHKRKINIQKSDKLTLCIREAFVPLRQALKVDLKATYPSADAAKQGLLTLMQQADQPQLWDLLAWLVPTFTARQLKKAFSDDDVSRLILALGQVDPERQAAVAYQDAINAGLALLSKLDAKDKKFGHHRQKLQAILTVLQKQATEEESELALIPVAPCTQPLSAVGTSMMSIVGALLLLREERAESAFEKARGRSDEMGEQTSIRAMLSRYQEARIRLLDDLHRRPQDILHDVLGLNDACIEVWLLEMVSVARARALPIKGGFVSVFSHCAPGVANMLSQQLLSKMPQFLPLVMEVLLRDGGVEALLSHMAVTKNGRRSPVLSSVIRGFENPQAVLTLLDTLCDDGDAFRGQRGKLATWLADTGLVRRFCETQLLEDSQTVNLVSMGLLIALWEKQLVQPAFLGALQQAHVLSQALDECHDDTPEKRLFKALSQHLAQAPRKAAGTAHVVFPGFEPMRRDGGSHAFDVHM